MFCSLQPQRILSYKNFLIIFKDFFFFCDVQAVNDIFPPTVQVYQENGAVVFGFSN